MPYKIPTPSQSDIQRFWSKVKKTDSCWIWQGAPFSNGYGGFWIKPRSVGAHRFSWALANGPIPEGAQVLHNCPNGDNKFCVNPGHLWLGTTADNMKDAGIKGQMPRGERNSHAILTADQVIEIRQIPRRVSHTAVGRKYGVAKSTIHNIRSGVNWRHLL